MRCAKTAGYARQPDTKDIVKFGWKIKLAMESDLEIGQLRLLDVDNRVNVPVDTHARIVVQSTDVLHDFAVPSLGIKIDATPGKSCLVS
jgi:heme/copper-type cytochrome/quinol oxidase subunit 2